MSPIFASFRRVSLLLVTLALTAAFAPRTAHAQG
jgi:hypothetical protein